MRSVNFVSKLVGVLFGLGDNGSEQFACEICTDVYEVIGAFLKFLPFFFGGFLNVGWFALCYFASDVVACFFNPCLDVPSNSLKRLPQEIACSGDDLLYIVRVVYLFFL